MPAPRGTDNGWVDLLMTVFTWGTVNVFSRLFSGLFRV